MRLRVVLRVIVARVLLIVFILLVGVLIIFTRLVELSETCTLTVIVETDGGLVTLLILDDVSCVRYGTITWCYHLVFFHAKVRFTEHTRLGQGFRVLDATWLVLTEVRMDATALKVVECSTLFTTKAAASNFRLLTSFHKFRGLFRLFVFRLTVLVRSVRLAVLGVGVCMRMTVLFSVFLIILGIFLLLCFSLTCWTILASRVRM